MLHYYYYGISPKRFNTRIYIQEVRRYLLRLLEQMVDDDDILRNTAKSDTVSASVKFLKMKSHQEDSYRRRDLHITYTI